MAAQRIHPSVCVLGSSNSGNCTLVQCGEVALLVDCGFPPSYLGARLAQLHLHIGDISGILITHTHADHVNDSCVSLAIRQRIPLFCPTDIELHLQAQYDILVKASHSGLLKSIQHDEIELRGVGIRVFDVPHDSPGGCFGYNVLYGPYKITVVTDVAYPTPSLVRGCSDSDILVMESNHDPGMLASSARPAWLKRRIRERGHLSNDQCADALRTVIDHSSRLPRNILLAHVSRECNTNVLALDCLRRMLVGMGIGGIDIMETHSFRASDTAGAV